MSREAKIGLVSMVVVLGTILVAGFTGDGEQGTSEVLLTLGIAAIAGAIVFGLVVP